MEPVIDASKGLAEKQEISRLIDVNIKHCADLRKIAIENLNDAKKIIGLLGQSWSDEIQESDNLWVILVKQDFVEAEDSIKFWRERKVDIMREIYALGRLEAKQKEENSIM